MEKKIEDYLHLYLGCEGHYFYLNGQFSKERLIRINVDGRCESEKRRMVVSDFKPILRPLSDMTDEEVIEYCTSVHPIKSKSREAKIAFGQALKHGYSLYPHELLWLLSKHFDLFGLIEAGLAIDKTTVQI